MKVIGKRKREVGLVMPATFIARTEKKELQKYSIQNLQKNAKCLQHFN